ncbi:MmgE/PrpD family protein [Roseibium sp. MMSF_3412]|uniref:MmgE/PrpD family protein n=1 Tax=Roseibium sp. MMSF_3412 TaxID=3046712 RepID=UPI00273EC521|nr:MmgE/PrpD family protein [Roseibium sp. MMSF_3412]
MLIGGIAGWITGHPGNWSETVLERARFGIADTVGCIVAASDHDVVGRTAGACLVEGSGKATPVFGAHACSASTAAFVNGTAAHVLEIDDNFYPALTHASAQAVPALFALAEEHDCSGRQVVDAYLHSLEIQAAIASAMGRGHTLAGWHATGTLSTIATAGAAAHMIGLSRSEIANAMSIACSMAAGTKAQFGTMTKSLHCGFAARNSVEAALLAASGIRGSADALDGPHGFLAMHSGNDKPAYENVLESLHASCAVETYGLAPKRHACCASAHKGLDAVEDLKRSGNFDLADIERIDVSVGTTNRQNLRYDRPRDGMEARFSLPYAMIAFLLGGKFWLDDLHNDAVHRPEVQSQLEKVHVTILKIDEKSVPITQPLEHMVTVRLNNGQEVSARRSYAKGTIADPFTEQDYLAKFLNCCTDRLDAGQTEVLWSGLRAIDALPSVAGLIASGFSSGQAASLSSR